MNRYSREEMIEMLTDKTERLREEARVHRAAGHLGQVGLATCLVEKTALTAVIELLKEQKEERGARHG